MPNRALASADQALEMADQALESADPALESADQALEMVDQALEIADQTLEMVDPPLAMVDSPLELADPPLAMADPPLAMADPSLSRADQPLGMRLGSYIATAEARMDRQLALLRTSVVLALSLLFAGHTGGATGGEVSLAVSTKKNVMELRVGGKTIRRYDVSVGTKSHPTPHGTYRISHIVWNPAWVPPKEKWAKGKKPTPPGDKKNPMKVVKIFFKEPDYYIHGTSHEGALGGAASHGCIRMSQSDAFRLGRYLMDHGGAPRSDAWYAGVFERGVSADVRLKASAKIVIGP